MTWSTEQGVGSVVEACLTCLTRPWVLYMHAHSNTNTHTLVLYSLLEGENSDLHPNMGRS